VLQFFATVLVGIAALRQRGRAALALFREPIHTTMVDPDKQGHAHRRC
jgi:hypothetical protein